MMNKFFSFFIAALFTAALFADGNMPENSAGTANDTLGDKFYVQIEAGFGADFKGNPGRMSGVEGFQYDDYGPDYSYIPWEADRLMRNQFGVTAGIDFNWRLFQKTSGDGAGEFYFGFGFDFQYWAPTSVLSSEAFPNSKETWQGRYAAMHYIRIPVMLNTSYEFKVNAGVLRRVGPRLSAGINNNLFILEYDYDHEREKERKEFENFSDNIDLHNLSFAWSLGLNLVFSNRCFLAVSVGGDKGSEQVQRHLFNKNSGLILYNHHEFLLFETGYRF